MRKSTFLAVAVLLFGASIGNAETLDYKVENGKFITSEGIIPAACFGLLKRDINGDNSIAAIYVNRPAGHGSRGCINSKNPYPGGNAKDISYEIIAPLNDDIFKLKVCERFQQGNTGGYCDNIVIRFKNREYVTPEIQDIFNDPVLSIEKIGEWQTETFMKQPAEH